MRTQALINVEETDIRVAILEDGALAELFVENMDERSTVGNIFKGRVDGIIPSLKAVFVDIGNEKNAFLHYNDVLPEWELPERGRPERDRRPVKKGRAAILDDDELDEEFIEPSEEEKGKKKARPLRVGDEIVVQVVKEEISTKGARITNYVSLPGRYLVFMPFSERGGGISRRIEDPNERKRLRKLLKDLKPESGGSFIIRTAGLEQDEEAIRRDAAQLLRNWEGTQRRNSKCRAPAALYEDKDMLARVVRDNFSPELDEILIDSKPAMRQLIHACEEMVPELCKRIHYYDSTLNIFDTFEVEQQFQKALKHKVWLRSGGALVIDETEALVAIDINSGKSVGKEDQDTLILKTNLEACRAIARQLRLRDLGGLVVIDFIDMSHRDHENQVMREFKRCLRSDRAKFALSDFSEFGLVQMTRKRVRKSLANAIFQECPYCDGSGRILSHPQLWKQLKYDLIAELEKYPQANAVDITVHSDFKTYLQEKVVKGLSEVAGKYTVELSIRAGTGVHHEQIKITTRVKPTEDKKDTPTRNTRGGGKKSVEKKLESTPAG